jgi:hypothetical protein
MDSNYDPPDLSPPPIAGITGVSHQRQASGFLWLIVNHISIIGFAFSGEWTPVKNAGLYSNLSSSRSLSSSY